MNWIDNGSSIDIHPPLDFNFEECLVFLGRSEQEVLHQKRESYFYKLIKIDDEFILLKLGKVNDVIRVEFPIGIPTPGLREKAASYVWEYFDMKQELGAFYDMAYSDKVLQNIVKKYRGLRIICIPDLFEALTWAIIGQQINLTFAYRLKKRFVEHFGECLTFEENTYWLYPEFETIAHLHEEDLRKLQFTTRKAEYIIGVAKAMKSGHVTKEALQQQDYQQVKKSLMAIRGVGAWTADYVMMKCLHDPVAFPVADVGLHQAIKLQLGLERKPSIEELEELSTNWAGWQAYATFYLWRSLYE